MYQEHLCASRVGQEMLDAFLFSSSPAPKNAIYMLRAAGARGEDAGLVPAPIKATSRRPESEHITMGVARTVRVAATLTAPPMLSARPACTSNSLL